MPLAGDEYGLFWNEVPTNRRVFERPLPPIPTGLTWQLPEGEAAYPHLGGQGMIAIDVETHDPDLKAKGPGVRRDGYIAGVAVGTEAGFRQYYPVRHQIGPNLPANYVFGWLSEQLRRTGQPKVGANILYDLDYLTAAGVEVAGPFYDVQVAEPLLDENRLSYGLEAIARHHLGEGKRQDELTRWLTKAFGDEENIKQFIYRAPSAIVGPYAESDVDLPLRIFAKQKVELERLGLWDLFLLESRLIPILLAMRQRGVRVDLDQAEQLYKQLGDQQRSSLGEIKREWGFEPNIWAAADLAKLCDKAKIQYPRTEKTAAPSFQKAWMEQHPHPLLRKIKDLRGWDKNRSTFVKGYILDGHVKGRLHCQFHQLRSDAGGTVSGRFSSSHPNLQNIPIRDPKFGKAIRSVFLPEEGQAWWKKDWSQIEYRLICHYAARNNLRGIGPIIERYRSDASTDYHQVLADMTGLPRASAKNLNFGLAYGQGIDLLCYNLGVDRAEGEQIIAGYHNRAPFIRPLMSLCSNTVRNRGEIKTFLARRRRFTVWEKDGHFFQTEQPGSRRAFLHKALNALIQGSAADIMKLAMVLIWEAGLCDADALGAPHLTVHDELDGSMTDDPRHLEAVAEIKHIMETCVTLEVPMLVDEGIGESWGAV